MDANNAAAAVISAVKKSTLTVGLSRWLLEICVQIQIQKFQHHNDHFTSLGESTCLRTRWLYSVKKEGLQLRYCEHKIPTAMVYIMA